jgi:hypothetical protein
MASIWDFFGAEAGQRRTAALNRLESDLAYYIPPELRQLVGLLADSTPTASMGRAGAAATSLLAPDRTGMERFGDFGEMLSETAGVAAPLMVAKRAAIPAAEAIQEALLGGSVAAREAGRNISDLASRIEVDPNTLGSMGGNVRLRPQTDAPFDEGGGVGGNGGPVFSLLDATANLPPHSRPEWSGAAENRTTPYPRYEPLRGAPERMQRLTAMLDDPANPIHDKVREYVSRGQGLGGEDWYNTEELRAWFVDELGEKIGDARWREYVNAVGHTSTGSSVPSNLRNASLYYMLDPADRLRVADMVKNTPRTTPRMAVEALGIYVPNMPVKYGYGHKMQGTQAGNVANAERGLWDRDAADGLTGAALTEQLSANSKVKGFLNNLLGDDINIAADKHFMRVMAMADGGVDFLSGQAELSAANREMLRLRYGDALDAYTSTRTKDGKTFTNVNLSKAAKDGVITDTAAFSEMPTAWEDMPKATEYKALENVAQRLAAALGITPAQFQANLWMGAGDVTGLADESQGTFMELFRRTADKRAAERGVSRTDQIRDFINKGAPMAIGGGGLLSTMMPQEEQY